MAQEAGPVGAFPPPPGRTPNFDHPEDLGRTSLTVGLAIMAGFTTVMFGLRNYAKKTITSQWYTEDWTCIAAYGLWMLYISTVLVMAHYGEGYHEWEVTKEAYKEILRWLYVGSILYCPAAYFTKVTLLLLEARVFAVYEKVSRGVFIFITVLLICYVPIMLLKAVVCIPIAAAWDQDVKPANCLNQRKVFISDMCLGVLTDLVILILPLVLTFSLHMPIWTKIKVVALLGAGGVATGVSIYRLYKAILFLNPTDTTEGFVLLDITTAGLWNILKIMRDVDSWNSPIREYGKLDDVPKCRDQTYQLILLVVGVAPLRGGVLVTHCDWDGEMRDGF
ncbi:integral membrane protein [Colletotrichum karsti]|uniref:Integral membrane protein n=1 Tax=Colletotrichum karsti TaxID=1095194 RepID=A0A9P6IC10_9PEZI|nr:uncharacterized protein CkaCkLH20_02052 [Colletotrichum karsti]KAF9880098.1 integral membrane protein [Colletotrichum karsti]